MVPAMGQLTSAERRRAAAFGTKVALLSTNLDCWLFPATLWDSSIERYATGRQV